MSQPKLLDQVRNLLWVKHYNFRTEETFFGWIRRFILFHGKRHPTVMSEAGISVFLTTYPLTERIQQPHVTNKDRS